MTSSEVVEVTSEVAATSEPSAGRHRGRRKVRRRWRLSWLPPVFSVVLLALLLHNARYSAAAQSADALRLTLLDVESDGGPLDEHSIAKRKIGDVALLFGQNLG